MEETIKIELLKKREHYELYLLNAPYPVVMFTGGHVTIDDNLLELGKSYKRFDKVSKRLLLEKEGLGNFDFRIWYWIDIIKNDKKTERYCFTLQDPVLKIRNEKMPIDNNEYVVTNIRQIGKDELSICFWLNKDHTFVLDTAGHIFSDKKQTPKNILDSMNDIKNQIHIKDWLSKLSVYKEE